jgi:hypothetical protein
MYEHSLWYCGASLYSIIITKTEQQLLNEKRAGKKKTASSTVKFASALRIRSYYKNSASNKLKSAALDNGVVLLIW